MLLYVDANFASPYALVVFVSLVEKGLDFDIEEPGLTTLMSRGATGEPRPVHASHPAPATKLPLFP